MSVYGIPLRTLAGEPATLGELAGKTVLVVNVASKCGLTPQYEGLERLQPALRLRPRVQTILGVPWDPSSPARSPGLRRRSRRFCSATYGTTFPLTEKLDVNGRRAGALYA